MNPETQAKLERDAANARADFQTMGITAARPSLRERIQKRYRLATVEAVRSDQLNELAILLDKNPEVARILELIEALNA